MDESSPPITVARISGFAVASLICGILLPPLGLIFGIVGIVQTGTPLKRLHGRGMAIAGLIESCFVSFVAVLFPIFSTASRCTNISACISNQRQIATAANMYAQDNDNKIPKSMADLKAYQKDNYSLEALKCPSAPKLAIGYGLNASVHKTNLSAMRDPARVLLTADSDNPHNVINSSADIAYRHGSHDSAVASFCDGHVLSIHKSEPVSVTGR